MKTYTITRKPPSRLFLVTDDAGRLFGSYKTQRAAHQAIDKAKAINKPHRTGR